MKCIYLQFFAISLVTKSEGGGEGAWARGADFLWG